MTEVKNVHAISGAASPITDNLTAHKDDGDEADFNNFPLSRAAQY